MTGPTPQTTNAYGTTPATPFQSPEPERLGHESVTSDALGTTFTGATPAGAVGNSQNWDAWAYREDAGVSGAALAGFKVEATDGHIGKVDSASTEVGAGYLVVDTGPWIFGKKVLLPAGVVNNVDHDDHKVYVDRTKEQIKSAPEYDDERHGDPVYRDKIGGYYGDSYATPSQIAPPRT